MRDPGDEHAPAKPLARDLASRAELLAEVERLTALINSPQIVDFLDAAKIEAIHQRERWGVEHDAGKRVEDWVTLFIYLLGKLSTSYWAGNHEKVLHHVITVGAVALNMHANLTGEDTRMRPGIADWTEAR